MPNGCLNSKYSYYMVLLLSITSRLKLILELLTLSSLSLELHYFVELGPALL